jgi:hypothetical protein
LDVYITRQWDLAAECRDLYARAAAATTGKFCKNLLTLYRHGDRIVKDLIQQTVEAEITAVMPLQRAWGAESQVRDRLSNGPLRAQSNGVVPRVFCDAVGKRINAGGMQVSC